MAQGVEFRINTPVNISDDQIEPSVTGLNDGGFVVAWSAELTSPGLITARRFDANGIAQGNDLLVNAPAIHEHRFPSITDLTNGGFVVVWQSSSQDFSIGNGIYGQRYDSNGVAQCSEFIVNSFITDDQSKPSVAGLKDGGHGVHLDRMEVMMVSMLSSLMRMEEQRVILH